MLAQIAITWEAIGQGAVPASILAGFAFVCSTSARDRSTVVLYFAARTFMLVSLWAGLMVLVSEDPAAQNDLANVFFSTLGIGSVLFVLATVGHITGLQGRRTAAWRLGFALVVTVTGIILGEIARR